MRRLNGVYNSLYEYYDFFQSKLGFLTQERARSDQRRSG